MIFLVLTVCLAAELHPSSGQGSLDPADLMTTNEKQQKEIVDTHNDCRRKVQPQARNMLKMVWNDGIAANAQKWANKCTLNHSPPEDRIIGGKTCGENLFMASHAFPWSYAIVSWYNETKDFEYGVGAIRKNAVIGHFTQVVWAKTFEVGCAFAFCPDQPMFKYFKVCQYCPTGNYANQMKTPYETGTPCGACPNDCDKGLCTNPCTHDDGFENCKLLVQK